MLKKWLQNNKYDSSQYVFNIFHFNEFKSPDNDIKNYIGSRILISYKDIDYLRGIFSHTVPNEKKDKLEAYLKEHTFPDVSKDREIETIKGDGKKIRIVENVRQGDWGEILTPLIVHDFRSELICPDISKFRWKLNNNRSTFGTDLMAHNKGDEIKNVSYFEIKTRTQNDHDVAENAYWSLFHTPKTDIANFLSSYYWSKREYNKAKAYSDIILNPDKYKYNNEIVLILEKKYCEKSISKIFDKLHNIPPSIGDLSVTVVLIENIPTLINDTYECAVRYAAQQLLGDNNG